MISRRKKVKYGTVQRINSDRNMTLKTRDIVGPGKYLEDPIVILVEDNSIGVRIIKRLDEICKGLSQ